MKRTGRVFAVFVFIGSILLSNCTHIISKRVRKEGVPEELVFPDKSDAWNKEGSYPGLASLQVIAPGVKKETLYQLIGPPHFSERFRAREWDYIFNFRDANHNFQKQCQYKIIFDADYIAQSFYWMPRECGEGFYQSQPPKK